MTTNKGAFTTKEISATSRMAVKIADNYYTFECSETRTVDMSKLSSNLEEAENEINEEWSALWDTVNGQLDNQILELKNYLQQRK